MSASSGFVCLAVGDEQYAVRADRVRLIARAEQTIDVPVCPMAGVFDVAAAGRGQHVVVIDGPGGPIGWSVDRVQRAPLSASTVMPLPSLVGSRAAAWFEGVVVIDDRATLVLSEGSQPAQPPIRQPAPPSSVGRVASSFVITFTTPALPAFDGGDRYALSARQVVSVAASLASVRVPGGPPHVAGVAVCNGELATIVDVRPSADRPESAGRALRLLVARTGARWMNEAIAFPVGAAVSLQRPTPEERAQPAADTPAPFLHGLFQVAGERIGLLNLDAMGQGG